MSREKNPINGHVYTEGALCTKWRGDFGPHHCFQAQIHTQKKSVVKGKALQDQTNKKHGVYDPLITIAEKQFIDWKRLTKPTFITAAMSTAGEMGRETIQLQEWLTASYARMLGTLPKRDDDIGIKKLTADFRNRYRNRIAVAVARGQAQMCLSAGLPVTSCKKYREQACG